MHIRTSFLALCTALAVSAAPVSAQDETPTADTVVATVNGVDITLGHMIVLRARLPQQYQNLPDDVLFQGILDQVVQQALLAQTAGDLAQENALILDNERRALLAAQAAATAAETALTDEALQAAYDEAYGNVEPETEFNASHILVETEEEAASLITELEGGADFADLAREHSTGPSGPNGGQLGWFSKGMMVAPFEEAVVALDVGAVSEPVQTQFGWHVITLNETREKAPPALEEVRGDLANQIQRSAVEQRIAELTEQAEVKRAEAGSIDPAILRNTTLIGE